MKNYLFILILCLSLPGHAQEYSAIKGFVKGAKLKDKINPIPIRQVHI